MRLLNGIHKDYALCLGGYHLFVICSSELRVLPTGSWSVDTGVSAYSVWSHPVDQRAIPPGRAPSRPQTWR